MYATYILIGLTALASIQAFQNRSVFYKMLFNPTLITGNKEWHRFITHGFIHADFPHLIFNMLTLYFFGPSVETKFIAVFGAGKGIFLFILLYIGGIVLSSYPSFEKQKHNTGYNAVGASGAVSAVVLSWILIFPTSKLSFIILPFFGIPGFIFGLAYMLYSSYMAKRNTDNIGHDAHLWGAVFGLVFTSLIHYEFAILFIEQITEFFEG